MIEISGKVTHGKKFGRVLGFPTANLDRRQYVRHKLKIKLGIWAGSAILSSRVHPRDPLNFKVKGIPRSDVMPILDSEGRASLGLERKADPPSVGHSARNGTVRRKAAIVIGPIGASGLPKIEAHLIGYKGNLYGKEITINLKKFIRPFKKYKDVDTLKKQILNDVNKIKKLKI